MKKIKAEVIAKIAPGVLWDKLKGRFELVFTDGSTMQVREKDVLYSSYAWEFFRRYPLTPITPRHIINSHFRDGYIGTGTHLDLVGAILFDVYDAYENRVPDKIQLLDELAALAYDSVNWLYNELITRSEEYVVSIDLLHFTEIADQPDLIRTINDIYDAVDESKSREELEVMINNCYALINKSVRDPQRFRDNPLALAAQSGIVSMDQLRQCVGPRGFLTDVDSMIFKKPILRGFIHGLRSLADSMMESRSASLSLAMQQDPLEKAEYFSRRLQLQCLNVKHVHVGDCGSTNYIYWRVRGPEIVNGKVAREGDLRTIAGKFYMDDDNVLKVIKKTDKHLIGRTIRMRSMVAGCRHEDPYGVCMTCHGETGLALPKNTNLGHACTTSMTQFLTQIVLSTKHFIGSSTVGAITLNDVAQNYLRTHKNSEYYLKSDLPEKFKTVRLIVPAAGAPCITDIHVVDDVSQLNLRRVSEFKQMVIQTIDADGVFNQIEVDTYVDNRIASLSKEVLQHIKTTGISLNSTDGSFVFDMTGWNYELPILVLPLRHFNMSDHQKAIEALIEGSKSKFMSSAFDEIADDAPVATTDDIEVAEDPEKEPEDDKPKKRQAKRRMTPDEILVELHDLVNKKLAVNLATLEVIVYAYSAANPADKDYSLPKPWTQRHYGDDVGLHNTRSFGQFMAYEKHQVGFTNPMSYLIRNRPNHPFDWILAGNEIERLQKQRGQVLDC